MNDTTQTSVARRGALYLVGVGVVGVLMAAYLMTTGLVQVWRGGLLGGLTPLVFGALLGAAGVRVLKVGREARSAIKRPPADS